MNPPALDATGLARERSHLAVLTIYGPVRAERRCLAANMVCKGETVGGAQGDGPRRDHG